MSQEICHYPGIDWGEGQSFKAPNVDGVREVYGRTGFPETVEGVLL